MSLSPVSLRQRAVPFSRARDDLATTSDDGLVARIAGDDDRALGELYRRHGRWVYADARDLRGQAAAESLTRSAFVALWQLARNGGTTGGRSVGRLLRDLLDTAVAELDRSGTAAEDVRDRSITYLLAALPVVEARVLTLVVVGECTFREAAALLGSSESAVRRAATRGLRRLHGVLVAPGAAGRS